MAPDPLGESENTARGTEASISRFVDVFLDPILDYLEMEQQADDLVLATMVRYKQRSEWFNRERLVPLANPSGRVEERLKQDFFCYLFDQGLEFVIEAMSPGRAGLADVLSARLPEGRRLVVEAKVYDGGNRGTREIRDGVSQAADYARDWGEPCAHLLIYNIAQDAALEFRGASFSGYAWIVSKLGREVRIVSVDLCRSLPPSRASQLQRVVIDLLE